MWRDASMAVEASQFEIFFCWPPYLFYFLVSMLFCHVSLHPSIEKCFFFSLMRKFECMQIRCNFISVHALRSRSFWIKIISIFICRFGYVWIQFMFLLTQYTCSCEYLQQNFLVDIKGPTLAFLPVLAFEGGTRRNIPKFEVHSYFHWDSCLSRCDTTLYLLFRKLKPYSSFQV